MRSVRNHRQTKKIIHEFDEDGVFTNVELVALMDDALKNRSKYYVKMKHSWSDAKCKHWLELIKAEPHWQNLDFRYSSARRSFIFYRK